MTKVAVLVSIGLWLAAGKCVVAEAPVPLWQSLPDVPPLPRAEQSGFAPVNGINLYYAIFNRRGARPVILLHGGLGSSESWGFEVPALARHHEVIVVDSRGHGRSTLGAQPLSYELMASDVLRLMDQLKIRKASIVGVSDGGIIGLLLAIHHPERIDTLFAYGANFNNSDSTPPPWQPDRAMFLKYKAKAEADYRKLSPTPDGFAALVAALNAMYAHEPDIKPAELATIKAPTVIADGQYEQFISRNHTEELARLIPGAKLVIISGVSHGGPTQDPSHFHQAVEQLLDGSARTLH